MQIADASIRLSSDHAKLQHRSVEETLEVQRVENRPINAEPGSGLIPSNVSKLEQTDHISNEELRDIDAEFYQLKALVESFTGKVIELSALQNKFGDKPSNQDNNLQERNSQSPSVNLIYEAKTTIEEYEKTGFQADGSITTADGKVIEFSLEHLMSREFYQETNLAVNLTTGELVDPLVLNLDASPLKLSDEKFEFDLNLDGQKDNISFVEGNRGFVAIDINQNGIIDDGSELFGAKTGDGFAELAQHDEDGNRFIDANDSVFQSLLLWQKDQQGNDKLTHLHSLGVGALYTGSTATPFEIKKPNNELQGAVRASGIYVNENASIGLLQQVDLVV